MDAATDAFNEDAIEGMQTRASQALRTSSDSPEPSAPMQTASLPWGRASGVSPASGTAATRRKPALAAVAKKSTDSSSRATGVWKIDPIVALTVLGLYRSAEPLERATPAPKAWAERMAVPTFPGS